MDFLVAILLLVLAYLPGHFIGGALARKGDGLGERVMLRLAASVAVAAPLLVALALAGLFTVPAILVTFVALSVVAGLCTRRVGSAGYGLTGWDAALLGLVGGGLALYSLPAEYVINSRDPGVYVVVADKLVRTGDLLVRVPLVGDVAPFHELAQGVKYPGFNINWQYLIVTQYFPGTFAI